MSKLSLEALPGYTPFPGPVVLAVMDGIGIGKQDETDGVWLAHTPVLDALSTEPLYTRLKAHGTAVGQPSDDDMGNSEVGHNAFGAGRVFSQGAKLVNEAIVSGKVFEGDAWKQVGERANNGGTVHFIGLLSDGNVHSNIGQLLKLLDRCAEDGFPRVRLHVLTDGRDVDERSALKYLDQLEAKLAELSSDARDYRIASGGGRMIVTMDRYEANWKIVERGWKAHVLGQGRQFASAKEAVQTYYDEDPQVNDQFLGEFVIARDGRPVGTIEDGDAVVCFNFRGDRVIELSRAFEEDSFPYFERERVPDVFYAGMMQYDGDLQIPRHFLVEPPVIGDTVSEYLCAAGVAAYAVSETQKFGHVTYFWNGNKSGKVDERLETYVNLPSDDVPFQQRPWMKAAEITDAAIGAVRDGNHKFIRLNYPNGDMVGHTGIPDAVRIAVETVDLCLARLIFAVEKAGGVLVATADHGNADCLFTLRKDGGREPHVAHTLNPVPFIIKDFSGANDWRMADVPGPGLSHIAATLLALHGYCKPETYDPALIALA